MMVDSSFGMEEMEGINIMQELGLSSASSVQPWRDYNEYGKVGLPISFWRRSES